MKKAIIAAFAVCWVVLSAFAVSLVSCSGSSDQAGFDIKSEAVCVLDENLLLLDAPTSLGVVEGNGFMVAAGDDIILYGFVTGSSSVCSARKAGADMNIRPCLMCAVKGIKFMCGIPGEPVL